MVDFNDLPKTELKKFIVVENNDSFGNRLFIIKKRIPFNQRTSYNKKYSTKDIPHVPTKQYFRRSLKLNT